MTGPDTAPAATDPRAERILARLDALFRIGLDAGTNRLGLTPEEDLAHHWVRGWMVDAGLDVEVDSVGNTFGRLPGSDREVWSGSHLDTPPDGGRLDGALGVIAALDAVEAIAATGGARDTLAVVAFRMEEGCRFGRGCFGSRAVLGELENDEAFLRDANGVTLEEAFVHVPLGSLPTGPLGPPPACFVEAHIEQGPSLAAAGAPLGVVTSIAGMAGIEIAFTGRRGHAGTVAMALRADALAAAAAFVGRAHAIAREIPGAVATIGRLVVSPGATNTIPGRAELFADVRAPDAARLDALVSQVVAAAGEAAAAAGCELEVEPRWRYEPVTMHSEPVGAIRRAVESLGVDPVELPSGAGHDAAIMGMAGIPAAMLFVRSDAGGVSHAPEEATGADAVGLCARALEAALRELAGA